MNPIERLNAARKAWSQANAALAAAHEKGTAEKVLEQLCDAADEAHDAYLMVLEDVTKELSLLAQWDVQGCLRCYGTGLEPALEGDQGLEFTWCCEACAGDGMARRKQWTFEDDGPDRTKKGEE